MTIASVRDWFYMVAAGNLEEVKDSIDTYIGARSKNGDTGLMVAARHNFGEIVRILAPKEYGLRNKDDYTALFIAISYDSLLAVEILAHYEAYMPIKEQLTPLHYAVILNKTSCLQPLIVALGHERDDRGRTALDLAYLMGHFDAAVIIFLQGYQCTPGVGSGPLIEHVHQFYKHYFEASIEPSN